ncbi:hypothetical protein [Shimazuella kribbensis]|uniref:hypothetical protein n=1 Tax=Shimazuella kribbensis TaxID=139808 RepID=UPI00042614D6|nr:hypothetical protein [Shimazuella kribbensis]
MNKKILVLIIGVGVLGLFLLSWIFADDEEQKPQTNNPPVTSDTPSQEEIEAKGNVNSEDLSQSKNNSIKAFARDFTTKYLTYNPSKPTAHIESVKNLMSPELYNEQMALFKNGSPTITNIEIRKIYITDIYVGYKHDNLTVPIDVTLTTKQGQKVDTTYIYIYNIIPDGTGWKVVGIHDESVIHE